MLRVNLYHISSVDPDSFEEVLNMALDYIWRYMHCAVIRISIYHYEDPNENGKLQVNTKLKNLLKSKGFKWKTVTNEVKSGQRIEVMECPNLHYKDQMDIDKCIVYREGLTKDQIHKEPFSFKFASLVTIAEGKDSKQGGD